MKTAGPAGCNADACTTNRTIAMKMTVMSNESSTRGSAPGAIRSVAIARLPGGAGAPLAGISRPPS